MEPGHIAVMLVMVSISCLQELVVVADRTPLGHIQLVSEGMW